MKEILVLADTTAASQQRIEIAARYAKRFGAHVTGLFIRPEIQIPQFVEKSAFLEARRQYDIEFKTRLEVVETQFRQAMADLAGGSNWIEEIGDFNDIVIGYSRRADLVLLGQHNPEQQGDPVLDEPDKVILRSGRPVMVVPYVQCPLNPPHCIVVAWDGSREAARALYDAMPLLQAADLVELCTIAEPKSAAAAYAGLDEMVVHLERHGVPAVARRLSRSGLSVGNLLLNHIVDSGADMLVAGAYGHNRLREVVLGGVTRDLLEHCSVPLLMSR
ncbi:MAG: universal stress protein [Thiolinea sp.]